MKNLFTLSIVLILMASCQPQNNAPQSQSDAPTINSLTITKPIIPYIKPDNPPNKDGPVKKNSAKFESIDVNKNKPR